MRPVPELHFVSVESGFGYLPYLLESLDWHWKNYGVPIDTPSRCLPSEYFRRQMLRRASGSSARRCR